MAESEHDELADALARLAGGDVAPNEHEPAAPPEPTPAPAATPQRAPRPATARPAAPAPVAAVAHGKPTVPAVRKQRPSAPTIRQGTVAPTDVEVGGGQSTGLSGAAEDMQAVDDDAVIVPAPEPSVFLPRKKPATSAEARAAVQRKKNLEYRRTLIPVLLTSGVLLLGFGVLKFFTGPDSLLQTLPAWIPIVLLGAGAALLILAGMNMMSVKQQH